MRALRLWLALRTTSLLCLEGLAVDAVALDRSPLYLLPHSGGVGMVEGASNGRRRGAIVGPRGLAAPTTRSVCL